MCVHVFKAEAGFNHLHHRYERAGVYEAGSAPICIPLEAQHQPLWDTGNLFMVNA